MLGPGRRLLAAVPLVVLALAVARPADELPAPAAVEAAPAPIVLPDPSPIGTAPAGSERAAVTGPSRALLADAPIPAAPEGLTGYVWPLPKGRLTLPYGPTRWGSRLVDGEPFHDGIDLATFCGDRIVAAHGGRVLAAGRRYDAYIGWRGDLGPYHRRLDEKRLWWTLPIVVVVDDRNGYRSVYAHFSRVVVEPGQWVEAGELLGYEGATGRASGCHLHYTLFSPLEEATIGVVPRLV
ncbi:MAG TPA: M23 family metallopeptidase, partial [Candidatus Limnocylindrales bacterium]|nr:M23 family metallopeptidase [Candidatus Limnocylindrales bacterium]